MPKKVTEENIMDFLVGKKTPMDEYVVEYRFKFPGIEKGLNIKMKGNLFYLENIPKEIAKKLKFSRKGIKRELRKEIAKGAFKAYESYTSRTRNTK